MPCSRAALLFASLILAPILHSQEGASAWAFQPLVRSAVPTGHDPLWTANPVDAFVKERLDQAGIAPAGSADRATLLRRLSFVLTGLPPTPDELAAFRKDHRPGAYRRQVDRLLASPHFGERWARHWMDLVRYAETLGHEFDFPIPGAWRYRDYLIRAFNGDVPYDRMITEHVAGDLVPAAQHRIDPDTGTDDTLAATAFWWLGEQSHSPVFSRQHRADRIDNQIDVVSKAFLGITVACARCHDHKFDPIPQTDYYALAGFLESSRYLPAPLGWAPSDRALTERAVAAADSHGSDGVLADFRHHGLAGWFARGPAVPDRPENGWVRSAADRQGILHSPEFVLDQPFLHVFAAGQNARISLVVDGFHLVRAPIYDGNRQELKDGTPRWHTIPLELWPGHEAHLEFTAATVHDLADPIHGGQWPGGGWFAVRQVVLSDSAQPPPPPVEPLPPARPAPVTEGGPPFWTAAIADGTGQDAPLLVRGAFDNRGTRVPRRFLTALGAVPLPAGTTGSGRLHLARWITAADNPLTGRTLVNRLWHLVFGRGLVATPDNLGHLGARPTHQELLDWLAADFIREGWSIKKTLRLLVTSRTFRLATDRSPDGDRLDPQNFLLHRAPLRRLDGETLRDALLAVSGQLDPTLFGPSVPQHLTAFLTGRGRPRLSGPRDGAGRRSVYLEVRRNFLDPFQLTFDRPVPFSCNGRRSETNVPAQALALLNDPLVRDLAFAFADDLLATYHPDDGARLEAAFRRALGRPPRPAERDAVLAFVAESTAVKPAYRRDHWQPVCHVLFNLKEFRFLR